MRMENGDGEKKFTGGLISKWEHMIILSSGENTNVGSE